MGTILDLHHEHLPDILEGDTAEGGETIAVAVTFVSPSGTLEHTMTGWVNVVSNHINASDSANATAMRSNVTVNWQTVSEKAGYPADGWQTNMPAKGWRVLTSNPINGAACNFVIENGGTIYPDHMLGPVTYFLTEYEEVTE